VQKLLKSVKIWQSGNQMYTATFYKPRQKSRFWFFQVRCAHRSGDVVNFIIVACRIFSRLKWYKNYKNRLRLAKVIVKNKMSRFYGSVCTMNVTQAFHMTSHWSQWRILGIKWLDHVKNASVSETTGLNDVPLIIADSRYFLFGHVMSTFT